jgi:hypothetical protein
MKSHMMCSCASTLPKASGAIGPRTVMMHGLCGSLIAIKSSHIIPLTSPTLCLPRPKIGGEHFERKEGGERDEPLRFFGGQVGCEVAAGNPADAAIG